MVNKLAPLLPLLAMASVELCRGVGFSGRVQFVICYLV
jgi:hypothetical protein